MLILQRKKSQSIVIGDNIKVTILDIGNDQVKIAIEAPKSIPVVRDELLEAAAVNKEAAAFLPASLSGLFKSAPPKK